jgi:hypothetical protein
MAGLAPAIHGFLWTRRDVDARYKPGMTRREKTKRPGAIPAFFLFVIPGRAKREA